MGGVAYLASLTEGLPRRPVIEEYIRIVKDKSLLRKLMLICSAAIARAADQSETALEVSGRSRVAAARSQREGNCAGAREPGHRLSPTPSARSTISTSRAAKSPAWRPDFIELDRMTSGLQKGELIIIAARPSMGKTAFAINIAQNAAVNQQAPRWRSSAWK